MSLLEASLGHYRDILNNGSSDPAQLLCIDMGIGVLTIQKSLKFFKIGIKSCRKLKNYVALDCALGDRGPMDPRGVPWDQNFWSKIFLISSSNDPIL